MHKIIEMREKSKIISQTKINCNRAYCNVHYNNFSFNRLFHHLKCLFKFQHFGGHKLVKFHPLNPTV